ncbi:flagellar biosynthesis anti-sigma factor FlgM [Chromobacterium sp. ATCC 53434]|uniref:flagellar biosynthesis anti-sigma factor FlgM n=1 Tax=Chromobacterium TaxID=535 RepID=UPI000C7897BC|nr:flagellar biosynthesis anti-sigma factor FlgM [Chromobacterium sp. ATCC 53434]AUH50496.1 flagellar biosynthesis anti-sigma factor FlgM [Chromobacterium sp. ATCC 53434]
MQISPIFSRGSEPTSSGKTESAAAAPIARVAAEPAAPAPAVALQAMPKIDQARVDEVRAALARGEVRFDPRRLAELVEQYHGGR